MPLSVESSSESEILNYLQKRFNRDTVSATEFRNFIGVSQSTDNRMRKLGHYPRIINLPGSMRNGRILLLDMAKWLVNGGCQISPKEYQEKINSFKQKDGDKKRGRPVGVKNKAKNVEDK